ncbi:MAG: HD domain-containing protein [Sporomusaceae bacterium]|nr:HD domain-containing protein [Sporomusaceae bacterium]
MIAISSAAAASITTFRMDYTIAKQSFDDLFAEFRTSQGLEPGSIAQLMALLSLIREMIQREEVLSLLNLTKATEHCTTTHSVNVAIVAGALAHWLELSSSEIDEAILGGLLHDVGKAMIPEEILNKQEKLLAYEFSIIRCHAFYSFQLVQFAAYIPENVKYAVLQHHERLDGSGYPNKLAEKDISFLAQILAVADVYDAMTSQRAQRSACSFFEVINELSLEMFGKLNPTICLMLMKHLKDLLVGSDVLLNTGEQAKIVRFDQNLGHKPLVQLPTGEYIDLEKEVDLEILRVIS